MIVSKNGRVLGAVCALATLIVAGDALAADYSSVSTRMVVSGGAASASSGIDATTAEAKARAYFTDRLVVTQHGKTLRFFSDVLKGRTVVVTLFYAGCSGVCPVNNEKLAELQTLLGKAIGRDVLFVSLTVDPEHDSVDALARYAARFGAGEGWLFLTGAKQDIDEIARRLGHTGASPEEHVTFFMIGNVPKAHWTKVAPYEPTEVILNRIRSLMSADRAADTHSAGAGIR